MFRGAWPCLALALLALGPSCRETSQRSAPSADLEREFLRQYAELAAARYGEAAAGAAALATAVDRFVNAPAEETLAQARRAWLAARPPYLQAEVCRFSDGPIDRVEGLVNAWPIDESYLDAVIAGHAPLTRALLVGLNEREGEKNISTGYHAIEYLLWGPDRDEAGPGHRPASDYQPPRRRGEYLRLAASLLTEHLAAVAAAWRAGDPRNHRAAFLALEPREGLRRVLKGLGTLAGPELGGERLTVAYETKDQENEHSCFSDNTHNDVIFDVTGIEAVVTGRGGVGLAGVLAGTQPALAAQLTSATAEALAAARAIPPPFDRAIAGSDAAPGRRAVKRTIDALEVLTALLARAVTALDVPLVFQI